jgi:hypothetical protein
VKKVRPSGKTKGGETGGRTRGHTPAQRRSRGNPGRLSPIGGTPSGMSTAGRGGCAPTRWTSTGPPSDAEFEEEEVAVADEVVAAFDAVVAGFAGVAAAGSEDSFLTTFWCFAVMLQEASNGASPHWQSADAR